MNVQNLKVAVIGSSIGGLSAANVLNRLGYEVTVFEALSEGFHNRGGALGSVDIQLLQTILPTGTIQKRIRNHGHFYGDLWKYLYEGLPKSSVKFGVDIQEILNPESLKPTLAIDGKLHEFDLITGADGGKSIIRKYVTDAAPQYAGYTLWRTLLSTDKINYPPSGSRTINGIRYETLGFPFIGANQESLWNCGVYMAMPESEVERPTRNRQVSTQNFKQIPDWFLPFIEHLFDKPTLNFWKTAIQYGKVSPHPVWEFVTEKVVQNRILLLGDAAHMASPRTGAGAYSAMVDAVVLEAAFKQGENIDESLKLYNKNTVDRGRELYNHSRKSASYFAPENRKIVSPKVLLDRIQSQQTLNMK
ncbi:MAG: 2-polyprenyl-6-methoxyphenol hydroxylase-like FAD-dependent oxidoreductase [Cyclobacteriaceae bacterium]